MDSADCQTLVEKAVEDVGGAVPEAPSASGANCQGTSMNRRSCRMARPGCNSAIIACARPKALA